MQWPNNLKIEYAKQRSHSEHPTADTINHVANLMGSTAAWCAVLGNNQSYTKCGAFLHVGPYRVSNAGKNRVFPLSYSRKSWHFVVTQKIVRSAAFLCAHVYANHQAILQPLSAESLPLRFRTQTRVELMFRRHRLDADFSGHDTNPPENSA